MFGGFFNRMYYGDPRKPDLKKEDVKGSRIKIFFTVLSIRFWQLIQLNLLYSIFWLPAFFLFQAHLIMFAQEDKFNSQAFFLLLIPCLMIAGPATAGVTYVIRNWARDEHAWVWSDFKDAWKANWKQSLLMMLINGVVAYLFNRNIQFYYANYIGGYGEIFFYLFCFMIMLAILYAMMNMFTFPMIVTYRLKLLHIIRNAFILTMIKLPFTFLIFALASFLVFLSFYYLLSLPFFVVGLTFPAFIVLSYVNWIFDKYINNRIMDEDEPASDEEQES